MQIKIICLISFILITTVIAKPAPDSIKSDILLRTFIESDNVPLNREVIYHVELRWQGDLNNYQIKDVQEPVLTNLTTRGSGSSNKVNTLADGNSFVLDKMKWGEGHRLLFVVNEAFFFYSHRLPVAKAAVKNRVGIEISSSFRLPKLDFLRIAKDVGAKFCFGSNGRYPKMGLLEYSLQMARELGLTRDDMFTLPPDGQKAIQR